MKPSAASHHLGLAPRLWRALLTAGLLSSLTLTACAPASPDDPVAEALPEETDTQAQAAITWTLGAQYDSTKANITFNVYSARATRIEVWLYAQPNGYQEKVKYVMTKNTTT